ncbi:MAG: hypothetical protein JO033_08570, partial [Acidobacteriaceae bacterium]|nr:hypothetical protein [Acidobacteriaceae bacterium]
MLAYAVLFGLYDRRWVPQQRAAVLDQSFRRLALAADQIRSRLENIARVLEAEADRKDRSYSRSADNTKHGQARNAEQTAPVRDFDFIKHCEKRPDVKEGLSFRILAGDKPAIFASLKRGETIVCGESPLEATIESATRDLVGTGFDDVAVITSTGRVIYQNQSSALRMATLGDLAATTMPAKRAASDDKGASSEKNEASAPSGVSYSRVADLSFAERKYKLLLQPIVLPVSDVATGADAEKVPSLELVGLIDEATLTTAARSLPYDWLINVTGLILLALVLTWPLLKISKMGPAEGFRPGETLAFGLSMLAATILVTVLAYYNSQVFSYQSMDDSLQRLAQSIDTHFTQEVTEALRTLKQLSEDPELQQELAKTLDKKEADRFQADPGVLVHKKVFNSPSTSQNKYQWFDQVFWVDEEGNQVLKWSSRSTPTGRTNVSSEPWFRNAKQGRFWTIDCVDPAPNSFVLDSVYSPNTTDYFGVIARVQPFRNTRLIATMATPFVSVINPLLSPMDGFAILDEKGVVRFHSDAAKNLRENFLNEIRPSQGMRSAIAARMPEVFTVHYSARKYRMRVQPISFDGNEAWTLIVFRDFTLRQRFFLNTLVLTVIYIAAYLCALSVLVAAGISVIRFLATRANLKAKEDWLRPTVNERFILWALVGLFALLLVLFRFLTGADHSQRQYLATVLGLPFTGLLAAYFALRYPSSLGWLGRAGELKPADCDSGDILCVTRKTKALNARKRIGIGNVLVFALTLLLTLVSVFPTAEFFEIAFSDSVVPNMEDLQVETARNVLARNNRIYAYVRSVATPSGSNFLQTRLSESMDRYTLQTDSKKSATTGVKLDAWLPNSIQTHWRGALGVPPLGSWLFANIAGVLKRVLPFPEEVRDGDRVGGSWNWTKGEWVGQPELEMLPPQHDPLDPRIEDDSFNRPQLPTAAMSDFPIANVLVPFRHQNSCGLLLIGLVVCLFGFTHYTVLRRFGLDFRPALEPLLEATLPGLAEHTTRNVLALNFPRTVNGQALNPL